MINFSFNWFFIKRYIIACLLGIVLPIICFHPFSIVCLLIFPWYIYYIIKINITVNNYFKNKDKKVIEKDLDKKEYKFRRNYFTKDYLFSFDKKIYKIQYKDIKLIDRELKFDIKKYLIWETGQRMILKIYDKKDNCYEIDTYYLFSTYQKIINFLLNKNNKIIIREK